MKYKVKVTLDLYVEEEIETDSLSGDEVLEMVENKYSNLSLRIRPSNQYDTVEDPKVKTVLGYVEISCDTNRMM